MFNSFGQTKGILFEGDAYEGYNRHTVDVRNYSAGVYIYRIEYEDIVKTYQIVVQ